MEESVVSSRRLFITTMAHDTTTTTSDKISIVVKFQTEEAKLHFMKLSKAKGQMLAEEWVAMREQYQLVAKTGHHPSLVILQHAITAETKKTKD